MNGQEAGSTSLSPFDRSLMILGEDPKHGSLNWVEIDILVFDLRCRIVQPVYLQMVLHVCHFTIYAEHIRVHMCRLTMHV